MYPSPTLIARQKFFEEILERWVRLKSGRVDERRCLLLRPLDLLSLARKEKIVDFVANLYCLNTPSQFIICLMGVCYSIECIARPRMVNIYLIFKLFGKLVPTKGFECAQCDSEMLSHAMWAARAITLRCKRVVDENLLTRRAGVTCLVALRILRRYRNIVYQVFNATGDDSERSVRTNVFVWRFIGEIDKFFLIASRWSSHSDSSEA